MGVWPRVSDDLSIGPGVGELVPHQLLHPLTTVRCRVVVEQVPFGTGSKFGRVGGGQPVAVPGVAWVVGRVRPCRERPITDYPEPLITQRPQLPSLLC